MKALARLSGPALFLVLAAYCLKLSIYNPAHNWDVIGYVASADAFAIDDVEALHAVTYAQVRHSVSAAAYADLVDGSFRQEISTNSSAFGEQLPFYRIRLVYTGLIYLLFTMGCDIVFATHVIPGVSVAAGIALLYAISRMLLARWFLYAIPFLAILFSVPDMARFATPDGLAFFSTILCATLYLTRRIDLLLVLLPVVIAVRTDLILFAIPLLVVVFLAGSRRGAAASACASLVVYAGLGAYFRNAGWSTVFYQSLVDLMVHPISSPARLTVPLYLRALHGGLSDAIGDPPFVLYFLVAMGSLYFFVRDAKRTSIVVALKSPTVSLALVCAVFVTSHFLAFPAVWDRFFSAHYMIGALMMLAMASDGRVVAAGGIEPPTKGL